VGKFEIEGIIASGGMGTVYRGRQCHPVQRPVALKMIKAGRADAATLARFLAERQVLALMDHPDIARVYEADATAEGHPYLAMEFCAGDPIDRYCHQRQLSLRQRVELVIRIARAISRAHAHGVIHRDLKPGNVLIAADEARPVLKIIDFGIAKWTAADPQLIHETQVGEMVGTPAYMSPEQPSGDVDTRTDVFAIGAILFRLLTGTTPLLPPTGTCPGLAEIIQHVQSFQAVTPCQRFHGLPPEARSALLQELGLPHAHQWMADVRGDLDWITLKALEAERTRRYATAGDLADDLERYLRQEPVTAAAPSRLYRWKKYYQRRRAWVWSLAGIATSLVVASSVSGFTWWRFEQQRGAERQRIQAEARTWLAQAIDRRTRLAEDPLADPEEHVAARTAAAKAESLLRNQPALVTLQSTLAGLQSQLQCDQQGFELAAGLEAARQQATEWSGPEPPDVEAGDQFGRLAGLRQMQTLLAHFGLPVPETPPDQAAQRLQMLPLGAQRRIVEALDFLLYEDPFGAGLYLHQQGGRLTIAEVVHGGGAERAGQFRPGDRVLAIDGVSLVEAYDWDQILPQAYRHLAGSPGQKISVTTVRGLSQPQQGQILCGGAAAHWAHQVLRHLDPDPWRTALREAVLNADLPRLRELNRATDMAAQRPFSLIQLAGTLFLLERSDAALRFLELAQQHHPQNFWANHYLGTALAVAVEPPQPEAGVRYLTAAVSLRPNSAAARMNLAEVLLRLGKEQEAIAHYQIAEQLSPGHQPVARRLQSLLERTATSTALTMDSRNPVDPRATDPGSAVPPAHVADSATVNFGDWEALEQQARHLARSGQRREALQRVQAAEQIAAADDAARDAAADPLPVDDSGQPATHRAKFDSASSLETTGVLRRIKGVVLLELQDFVAARIVLADAVRLNPGDAAARFYYGVALEHSGDSQAAVDQYEAALKIRPDYEAVREFLRQLQP
jgi:tetratricopeptide (TPR) repeat protein